MNGENGVSRLPLLKALKDLAKAGAKLDASIVTTYALNGLFYEEVLLRAFERAGSRLNVVLADAGQLTEILVDPLRRPRRTGLDFLLAPIPHDQPSIRSSGLSSSRNSRTCHRILVVAADRARWRGRRSEPALHLTDKPRPASRAMTMARDRSGRSSLSKM